MIVALFNLLAQGSEIPAKEESEFFYEPFLWVLAILAAAFIMLKATARKAARSAERSKLSAKERIDRNRRGHEMVDRVGELMAELADLSREIHGQLDTRIAQLDVLLEQADDKIAQLKDLIDGGCAQESPQAGESPQAVEPAASPLVEQEPAAAAPQGGEPVTAAESFEASRKDQENQAGAALETGANPEVFALSAQGLSALAIAQRLCRPVGEIELILALKRKGS